MQARPPADLFIGFGGIANRPVVREGADWFVTDFQVCIVKSASTMCPCMTKGMNDLAILGNIGCPQIIDKNSIDVICRSCESAASMTP